MKLTIWLVPFFLAIAPAAQTQAINNGFARSTGSIVAWLNSDDMYTAGSVKRGVEALAFEPFEPEVGDELRSPAVQGGPGPLVDEEPLVAVEQMDVGFGFGVRHELSAAIVTRLWISTWAR